MITEILLKVALNTIIWHKPTYQFVTGKLINNEYAIFAPFIAHLHLFNYA
jgi:hypothetical protein